jgi:hypothetical protein
MYIKTPSKAYLSSVATLLALLHQPTLIQSHPRTHKLLILLVSLEIINRFSSRITQ